MAEITSAANCYAVRPTVCPAAIAIKARRLASGPALQIVRDQDPCSRASSAQIRRKDDV